MPPELSTLELDGIYMARRPAGQECIFAMAKLRTNIETCIHCKKPHGHALTVTCSTKGAEYGVVECTACRAKLYFINRYIWQNMLGWPRVVGVERLMPRNEAENSKNKQQLEDQQGCILWMFILLGLFALIAILGSLMSG